jgi:hypothetical protein
MNTVDGRGQGGQLGAVRAALAGDSKPTGRFKAEAQWIWSHADAVQDKGGTIFLRKSFKLDKLPTHAVLVGTCDNEVTFYLNGKKLDSSKEWTAPVSVDLTGKLKVGLNVIAAEATNWPDAARKRGTQVTGSNPAAFITWVGLFQGEKLTQAIGSDATWLWTKNPAKNWTALNATITGWGHASELPGAVNLYKGVDLAAAANRSGSLSDVGPLRAALLFDDPLLSALGRTSREQVVTRRDSLATTLQGLELSNGSTLDAKLKLGAKNKLDAVGKDTTKLIDRIFLDALGRQPGTSELATARELVGSPATIEGVQDLLWTVVMLPEFQLIP